MMLLVAARSLDTEGRSPFTLADLTVRAWLLYPDHFGMDGYERLPDSHYVATFLMGKRGICGRNDWLEKCGGGRWRLTGWGRACAVQLELGRKIPLDGGRYRRL